MPGPGHYYPEIEPKIKKSKSQGNFGSLQKRFPSNAGFENMIGPGEYNPLVTGAIGKRAHVSDPSINLVLIIFVSQEVKVRNPPFLSSDTRFQLRKNIEVNPGPGAYDQLQNVTDQSTHTG